MVVRRAIVSLAIGGMFTVIVGLGAAKDHPRLLGESVATADPAEGASDGEHSPATGEDDDKAADEAAPPAEPTDLKIVSASWEVLAPGVLANGGLKPGEESAFSAAGLRVSFSAAVDASDLETQLGLGGRAKGGADIALMPLPTFVASYERLRALSPQVFFVVAWSRGRDALTGDATLLRKPPKKGPVTLTGRAGSAESLLGLFALQWAGVSPARVQIVAPSGTATKRSIQALRRRKSRQIDAREVMLSTADATRLIPIVAIAPKSVLNEKREAVTKWSRVWLQGTRDLASDPAGAARLVAGDTGAPKAVDLIDALGWVQFADLPEVASAVGLSGRRASTLDTLFSRTWKLWRMSGLIATPPPQRVPFNALIIAELAGEADVTVSRDPRRRHAPADTGLQPVLVHRVPGKNLATDDELALVNEAGFLADVFARSPIRITVPRDPRAASRIASNAAERFGLDPDRFVVVTKKGRLRGTAALLEVLPAV